jgi:ABC-type bacteriocin/lantibiotic exporter with double-glycine peptidase domain
MQNLKKLSSILLKKDRFRAIILLGMILIMSLIDMAGVASILPFIALLTNPEIIETNVFLSNVYQASKSFGIENGQQFLIATGFFVFILLITSILFKGLTTYTQILYVQRCEYNIAMRLLKSYLYQPYSWFLNQNSSILGKSILTESNVVVNRVLAPLINLISNSFIVVTLFILLFVTEPKLTTIAFLTISLFYGLVIMFNLHFVKKLGKQVFEANSDRFKISAEALGAFKEIKLGELEETYINQFSIPSKKLAKNRLRYNILTEVPRFTLEAIAFGGMLLIILSFMTITGNITNVLPVIALYAFAGYRLLPAIQKIYNNYNSLHFGSKTLDSVYNDLNYLTPKIQNEYKDTLKFNKSICLKNIHYSYPNASKTTLKNINLNIPINKTIGLVGTTGSGKTTAVDIILGLLEPQKGTLEIDDKIINAHNKRTWQHFIGYVPQQIFLLDNTVSANIAFGVNINDVNQEAVEYAAKIANLHEFVTNELPLKYQTTIGERGVRFSGGQRQRIGIARALYHKPKVLVLDEATSALDNLTEKAVMNAVHSSKNDITKILVAHRLSTVKHCDIIFLFDKGELKNQGTFEELIKNNDDFRESVKNL